MTKKKAQSRKTLPKKKPFKIVKKPNSSKKFREIKQNLETEPRNIETQKISESNKLPQINQNEKENILSYYTKSLNNTFYTYSSDILNNYLKQETNKDNLVQINDEILSKFGITKDLRKFAFKYLIEVLTSQNVNKKLYFKTTTVFDSFLINYSKNNEQALCSQFFASKKDGIYSQSKLIIFILCCYFIINQTFCTKNFELKCIEKWDENHEITYDDLNKLIYTILTEVDCNLDNLCLYDFLNLFLFDLNNKLKNVTNKNYFTDFFNQSVNIFSVKIIQDISLNNINPSAQCLGIIMFSYEYTKFAVKKNLQNDKINFVIENWIQNVKNVLFNIKKQDLKRVINWLNNYVNTH